MGEIYGIELDPEISEYRLIFGDTRRFEVFSNYEDVLCPSWTDDFYKILLF